MEEKDIIITDTSVESQEVAEPEVSESVRQAQETQPAAEKTDRDSYYRDMRRKQELEQSRAENTRLQRQIDSVQKILGNFFEGNTLEEQLDYASATAQGMDVSTYKAHRQEQAVQQELAMYRQREVDRMMADDLRAIQTIDPTVTSLNDLPDTFLALRFNQAAPMSAQKAFVAMKAIEQQTQKQKPASVGSIHGSGSAESEFFTNEELNSLTPKMLEDAKIMEKALRSMERLK